jgi:hypothetical protein
MIHSKQTTLIDHWKRVCRVNWDYIHNPHFQVFQRRSKPKTITEKHKKIKEPWQHKAICILIMENGNIATMMTMSY